MVNMTTFELIKKLAKKNNSNLKEVALNLGFGENAFYKWKVSNPTSDKLIKVADYFNVSTDYLLGRTNNPTILKDETSEALTTEKLFQSITTIDGKNLTNNDIEILVGLVEAYLSKKKD